ncbi:MAG: GNAT family N-acetyltransferase [Desulfobacterales bacterium]|jgi:ribosomal protein S18 acetylase RimI-like enzyme
MRIRSYFTRISHENDGIMLVRSIRRSDLPHIAAVQTESWRDSYADAFPDAYLANQLAEDLERHWHEMHIQLDDIILVAEENGIIGFIAVWCRPEPYIDNLHVKPSHRSKGIGSKLMTSAARQMIQQGHQTAYLWVVESNEKAIRLYERLGGVLTEQALKNLFGHQVPSVKIVWSDISTLCSIG